MVSVHMDVAEHCRWVLPDVTHGQHCFLFHQSVNQAYQLALIIVLWLQTLINNLN